MYNKLAKGVQNCHNTKFLKKYEALELFKKFDVYNS